MQVNSGMIGRGTELEVLQGLLDGARAGRGSAALIAGEAGIGKTTLVRELAARATVDGFEVLTAGADELAVTMPFAPLLEALGCRSDAHDPERAAVARALAEAPAEVSLGQSASPLVGRVVEGVVRILEGMALAGPTVLITEDLHWADRPTLVAVRTIARRLGDVPLVVVGTYRPAQTPDLAKLVDALDRMGATRVSLQALSPDDIRELALKITGGEPGEKLMTKLEGAGGNPLYVRELLRGLAADGAISIDDGVADIGDTGLPPTLRQMLLRGIGDLPEQTLDVLRMASVLGTTFSVADLATITSRDARDVDGLLRPALAAGSIEHRGERLAFRHDLVRDAVYEDIPEPVRRELHGEAAGALEEAGAPLTQAVQHMLRGAAVGEHGAMRRFREPLLEVAKTDVVAATELAAIALDRLAPDDPDRDYYPAEALALWSAGKLDDAEAILREKLSRPRWAPVEARLRLWLAQVLYSAGRGGEAIDEIGRAMAIPDLIGLERSGLYWMAIQLLLYGGDRDAAVDLAEKGLSESEREGDREGVAGTLVLLSLASLWGGRLRDAERQAERAVAMNSPSHRFTAMRQLCFALPEVDRIEDAEHAIRAVLAEDPDDGLIHVIRAEILSNAGRWDDALTEMETAAEGGEGDLIDSGATYTALGAIVLLLGFGRVDEAERCATRSDEHRATRGFDAGTDAAVTARALLQEVRGDVRGAFTLIRDSWDAVRPVRSPGVFRHLAPAAVRIAVAAGDGEFARHATEDAEDWASRSGVASAEALALRCRGLADGDPETLLAAIERYHETPHRLFERMQCVEEAAAALATAGRPDEARALYDEAIDAFDEMGASFYAQRATAAMRSFGMRRGAKGKRGRPTAGWESLTPTESQVVELVAEGMRNAEVAERLFIAPSTVSTHLRHVFQKLSLTSRVELTREFAARRTAGAH